MDSSLCVPLCACRHGWGGVGWGGVGWGGACVNVHVKLLGKSTRLCVCRYVRVDMGGAWVGWGMWNYKKMRFRLGEILVFLFMHQNKGVSCLWTHIKTIQVELVGEFWETSKMTVSPRRNARFWFYAPESGVFRLWNHINQNPIGTTTSNIIHDTPLITKTPRPDKGRVPSFFHLFGTIYNSCFFPIRGMWLFQLFYHGVCSLCSRCYSRSSRTQSKII